MKIVKKQYPVLAHKVMTICRRNQEAQNFMNKCKELKGPLSLTSVYIHAFWTPWLE